MKTHTGLDTGPPTKISHLGELMTLLLVAFLAGCTLPVRHNLEEAAADEIVVSLEKAGIAAAKAPDEISGEDGRFVVTVSQDELARSLELLQNLGLPRADRAGLGETYATPSLVPSATEERARFLEAMTSDLENTLETIDGVISARVHVVLEERDPARAITPFKFPPARPSWSRHPWASFPFRKKMSSGWSRARFQGFRPPTSR